ncbi:MAG: hypothetical protein A2V77_13175 [Anaeromyxobacter sp. RBG_16_69_14]|nr:MAG: hypothetical protein A2V77_13175 [Anaeromyxobacter sp. RBG_16_69_14]
MRALVGGTTSIQGSPPSNRPLDGWLVRNVEDERFGGALGEDQVLASTLTMKAEQLGERADKMRRGSTFIYHCAEGQPGSIVAREYVAVQQAGCLQGRLVHTNALDPSAYGAWSDPGSVVWSPFSNLWLYGATTDVRAAVSRGINVCIGSDWGPSGTRNVLGEVKVAALASKAKGWNLTAFELVKMITANPGAALAKAWNRQAGRLQQKALGDLVVIAAAKGADPFKTILAATEDHVQLVVIGGRPIYGTAGRMQEARATQTSAVMMNGQPRQLALTRLDGAGAPWSFHLAITSIVTGLRDAHTRYSGPKMLQGAVATLPFLVEQYGPHDGPTFVVSKVSAPELISDGTFKKGVELTSWNGIPFARAVDIYSERETGGRPDARRARALESLTFRALEYGPPPDEMWVWIGYRPARGAERQVQLPWRVVLPNRGRAPEPGVRASRFVAADPAAEQVRRAKKLLFSGKLWEAEGTGAAVPRSRKWVPTPMQDVLAARKVRHRTLGDLGYLRIWSFDVADDDAFIAEVVRLLDQLPGTGLILDLRGNPGGLIWAAERLLQLFTPNPITPTRFSLVATPLTRAMARSPFNRLELEPWLSSLETAIETGEPYSQPLPLTDPAWCNDIGQLYGGPVVCVVDPNTYSAGDLFAAGFVDNEIGPLVSVGEATGAGGANVWTHHDVGKHWPKQSSSCQSYQEMWATP